LNEELVGKIHIPLLAVTKCFTYVHVVFDT